MGRGTRWWGLAVTAALCGALLVAGNAPGRPTVHGAYKLKVDAVAYHLKGSTALGIPVRKGVVAVDPRVIPLGTRLHVPGYGPGIAADVGYAIKGRIIDLWFPSTAAARKWGRKTITITVYR